MAMSLTDQLSSTSPANMGIEIGFIPEEPLKPGSSSTDAETLLRALRNVVIPLACSADGEYKRHVNETALGPDGKEFIIALENFMMSFLHSQRGPVGGIEVDLEEKGTHIPTSKFQETSDYNLSAEDVPDKASNTEPPAERPTPEDNDLSPTNIAEAPPDIEALPEGPPSERAIIIQKDIESTEGSKNIKHADNIFIRLFPEYPVIFERRKQRFREKALTALREHVFNTMPIRLLYIKPHASKLQITLIERGEIYAHIASNLENYIVIDFAAVLRELTHWEVAARASEETAEEIVSKEFIKQYSRYAILSHTWLRGVSGEVTYNNWKRGIFDAQQPGYQKLVNFCKAAWENYDVAFGWMDTVCINKESSTELDESIRSMYKWYRKAHICITYLAETVTPSDMPNDTWFTRGWTLQELLAPSHIKFYNANWNRLVKSSGSDKNEAIILEQIEQATTITARELESPVESIPISRRMQMAAKRQVTREEDIAYSLMGIFDISISIAYGEGSGHAFSRLLQEVLNSSNNVADIFNWGSSLSVPCTPISSLLPSTPQGYLRRSPHYRSDLQWEKPIKPLMLTHIGLRVTLVLVQAILIDNPISQYDSIGDYHAITDIHVLIPYGYSIPSVFGGSYSVLDARISGDDGEKEEQNLFQLSLGILNVGGDTQEIAIPKLCLAVCLDPIKTANRVIKQCPTEEPIVFNLNKRPSSDVNKTVNDHLENRYYIKRSELASHGMKLATLYL